MDTSREFDTVKQKNALGAPVSWREVAVTIANDEGSLLQYLLRNDYIQVYNLLHRSDSSLVVGKNATFVPDKTRVGGELKSLFVTHKFAVINDILENFRINMASDDKFTTNANLIECLRDINAISMTSNGYKFNLQIS